MALTTGVTPEMIAVALGVTAPVTGSTKETQWQMWIDDALMLIQMRVDTIDPAPVVEQARLDYVIREAVVAQARRPDDSTQVTTSVDDGSVSRTYRSSRGRVDILDEWWALLGLAAASSGAFSIRPTRIGGPHAPYCSLHFGGTYCTCGANLTDYAYPLYEGGPLEP